MAGRVFSVLLLPTSECNVACDYCFEHKEPPDTLTIDLGSGGGVFAPGAGRATGASPTGKGKRVAGRADRALL